VAVVEHTTSPARSSPENIEEAFDDIVELDLNRKTMVRRRRSPR
jgi:hypothetical protein